MRRINRVILSALAGLSALSFVGTGQAAVVGPAATAESCSGAFTFSIAPIDCAGGYTGNLLSGSPATGTELSAIQALATAGGTTVSGTYIEKLDSLNGNNATGTIDFAQALSGFTIIGFHTGGAGVANGNATFFYSFNAPAGTDILTITGRTGADTTGLSNAVLYKTGSAVPEPATWALMLLGFGAMGGALRRSRHRQGPLLQIA